MRSSSATTATIALCFVSLSTLGDPVDLSNADVPAGEDGKLEIKTGDYGAWVDGDYFNPGLVDPSDPESFDPYRAPVSFAATYFLHVNPDQMGGKVALASESSLIDRYYNQDPYNGRGGPADYNLTLVQPNSTANLPAWTDSVFDVTGDNGIDVRFNLTQWVTTGNLGPNGEASAYIDQVFAMTNQEDSSVDLILIRHIDVAIPWKESPLCEFGDSVAVDFVEGCYPEVYGQYRNVNSMAMVLATTTDPRANPRTTEFTNYATMNQENAQPPGHPELPNDQPTCYGDPSCQLDVDNGGVRFCPRHNWGLDYQYWDRPGVPNCWKEFVPGVGYGVPGITIYACGFQDGSIGLQVRFSLGVGETYNISFRTTYGYRATSPETDCNQNGLHDDCELDNDCNGDDIPDECQLDGNDCNANGVFDDCESDNDCNGNGVPDDCESITDCNGDQISDECQLQGNNCNGNEIPDDCEPNTDCNDNGAADICDLADGTSPDCNANAAPDECDVASGQSPDRNTNGVPDECDPACTTNTDCADDTLCTFDLCGQSVCTHASARYGDIAGLGGTCGPDGDVDLLDILAVLNGFRAVFADGCASSNVDITGNSDACTPDGSIDLLDILAVLDAFQGNGGCCVTSR